MIKKAYVVSSLIMLSLFSLQARNQNRSTVFTAFDVGVKQQYSYGDQFEIKGHLQSRLRNDIPSLRNSMPLALLLYVNSAQYRQACLKIQERKQQLAQEHLEIYGMNQEDLWGSKKSTGLYQKSFEDVEQNILNAEQLTKQQALAIWDGYCNKRTRVFDKQKIQGRMVIEDTYDVRGYEFEVKNCCDNREKALQETILKDYQHYDKVYDLPIQTVGYLLSQGLQPLDFQELCGTALQHQLQSELCSVVNMAAIAARKLSYDSTMLKEVLLCADAGVATNKENLADLAATLVDVSHGLMGFVLEVSKESNRLLTVAAEQAVASFVNLPQTTVHGIISLYHLLDVVKNEVIRSYDFQRPVQDDLDELQSRAEIIIHGLYDVAELVKDWTYERSMSQKGDDLVKFVTDLGVNIVVPDIIISKIASACSLLASNLKNVHSLKFITSKEIVLQPALEAGMNVGQDVENLVHAKITEKIIDSIESGKILADKVGCCVANNINAQDALIRKLNALEDAPKMAVRIREFADGRVRYYKAEKLSVKHGPTRGASYVTEHNRKTGQVRSWLECYDHQGNVNRVHPKMLDGQDLLAQHYPPTKAEIEAFFKESKG